MAGKQDKMSHICQESCSLFSYSIAKVLLYVFVQVHVRYAQVNVLNMYTFEINWTIVVISFF